MKSGARDQPRGCPSGLVSVLARSLEILKLLKVKKAVMKRHQWKKKRKKKKKRRRRKKRRSKNILTNTRNLGSAKTFLTGSGYPTPHQTGSPSADWGRPSPRPPACEHL